MRTNFLIVLLFILTGCSFKKGGVHNERAKGHYQLYSMPDAVVTQLPAHLYRVVIASVNNIEGETAPKSEKISNQTHSLEFKIGGKDLLKKYTEILHQKYQGKFILINAGDSFKTSKDSESVISLLKEAKFSFSGIGQKDFELISSNNKLTNLRRVIEKSDHPFVLSNFVELKTGKIPEWKNLNAYLIKEINGVKVGFISVLNGEFVSESKNREWNGIYFEPPSVALLKNSQALKRKGAKIIVAVIHAEQKCGERIALKKKLPIDKVNFDPKAFLACDSDNQLAKILERLPKNTVHLVVTNYNGTKVSNFIHDVPVISSAGHSQYINLAELQYDIANETVEHKNTKIYQPVKLCDAFIEETKDCYTKDNSIDIEEKSKAKFFNINI